MQHTSSILAPLLAAGCFAATPAHAARCFSMYDGKNQLVMQTPDAPIDLSRPIEDQMRARYPTRFLVISDVGSCVDRGVVAANTPGQAAALLPSSSDASPYAADPSSSARSTGRDAR